MPSRDDDLDWLYGREKSAPSAPEPTQVMPGAWGQPGGGSARRPAAGSPPPPRAAGPAAPQQSAPEHSAPFDTAQYQSVPAYGQGSSNPRAYQDWRAAGNAPTPPGQLPPAPTAPGGRPGKGPRKRHPVRNVFVVLLLVVLASMTWLVAVPLHAWSQVQRVDDTPSGQRPAAQPGTTYLLV